MDEKTTVGGRPEVRWMYVYSSKNNTVTFYTMTTEEGVGKVYEGFAKHTPTLSSAARYIEESIVEDELSKKEMIPYGVFDDYDKEKLKVTGVKTYPKSPYLRIMWSAKGPRVKLLS